jgi:tetratricopeptide (TPR) repeat protein
MRVARRLGSYSHLGSTIYLAAKDNASMSEGSPGRARHHVIGKLADVDIVGVQRGGAGVVYFCIAPDAPDGIEPWVYKTFADELFFDPAYRRAFLRECSLVLRLSGLPGIMGSGAVRLIDGKPYLMLRGGGRDDHGVRTLRDLLNFNSIGVLEAAFVAWAVADTMDICSRVIEGFCHGDLKPENVIMSHGLPELIDFGAATAAGRFMSMDYIPSTPFCEDPLNRSSSMQPTFSSDIFAFGKMLQEILNVTEETDDSTQQNEHYVASNPEILSNIYSSLTELSRRCTSLSSDDRPAGFGSIAEQIYSLIPQDWNVFRLRENLRRSVSLFTMASNAVFSRSSTYDAYLSLGQADMLLDFLDPTPSEARDFVEWKYRGLCLSELGRFDEAISSLREALAKASTPADQYVPIAEIAVCLTHLENFDEAERWHRTCVIIADSEQDLQGSVINYAALQLAQGRYKAALALLAKLKRHTECIAEVSSSIGLIRAECLRGLGEYAEAALCLQRAIDMNPTVENLSRLADFYLCVTGEFNRAVPAYSAVLQSGALHLNLLYRAVTTALAAPNELLFNLAKDSFGRAGLPSDEIEGAIQNAFVDASAIRRFHGKQSRELEEGIPDELIQKADPWWVKTRVPPNDEIRADFGWDSALVSLPGRAVVTPHALGQFTYDLYLPSDLDEYISLFVRWYRQMAYLWAADVDRDLCDTAFTVMRCSGCGTCICTNRVFGSNLGCAECSLTIAVTSTTDANLRELERSVNENIPKSHRLDSTGNQTVILTIQPGASILDEEYIKISQVLESYGFDVLDDLHAAAFYPRRSGIASGLFNEGVRSVSARYRFETPERASTYGPRKIEDVANTVRNLFPSIPVNSRADSYDPTIEDFWFHFLENDLVGAATYLADNESELNHPAGLWILLAGLYVERSEWENGRSAASSALRTDAGPNELMAWLIIGECEYELNNLAGALEAGEMALQVSPSSYFACKLLAEVHRKLGNVDRANLLLSRAHSLRSQGT